MNKNPFDTKTVDIEVLLAYHWRFVFIKYCMGTRDILRVLVREINLRNVRFRRKG